MLLEMRVVRVCALEDGFWVVSLVAGSSTLTHAIDFPVVLGEMLTVDIHRTEVK